MTISKQVGTLPPFPDRLQDEPSTFSQKVRDNLAAQNTFVDDVNTVSGQMNATALEVNSLKVQTESLRNQTTTSATSASNSAVASANSASNSATSATLASNHVASAQSIVEGLDGTQYALSQIGLGFAGLVDGDLIVNYANPIASVSLSDGEISITF